MIESFSYQFIQYVKNTIQRSLRIHPAKNLILVACSGGPDSVVLLDTLYQLRDSCGIGLCVCHVHHGLRGLDADEDESFVIGLADRYDLPVTIRRFDADEVDKIKRNNLEESARQLRYQKLVHTAVELDCSYIATGHTRSDQAETVLQRITRSTGQSGLVGILPVRTDLEIPIVRPLLEVGREQVIRYARENGLSYRLDTMNADPQYTRVRIRKQLLPFLKKKFNPQIEEALAHMAKLALDDEVFWETYVDNLRLRIGKATEDSPADRRRFLHLTCAEQSRLLRAYVKNLGIDSSWVQIENALAVLMGDKPQSEIHFSADIRLYRRYDEFYFAPPLDLHEMILEYPVRVPGITEISPLGIKTEVVSIPANVHHIKPLEVHTAEFDIDKIREPIMIRTRREGDVICPLGLGGGTKKVKKILQEKRIPLEERDRIPLLCFDGDVAWLAGYCISETYRVDANTKRILLVSIHATERNNSFS